MSDNLDRIEPQNPSITIEKEMRNSYMDYAMSVIVSRAIPDACDGLKPVHRRILFAMSESGCDWNRPYRKSARIVGEVMGKYHPHGDSAIYQSLVRMAQDFSLRVPLIDGQGNFGSMDGDAAAAMRYTESRLEKVAHSMLDDLDKDTVDFHPNYDGSEKEPIQLPAKFPNLLVNGSGGIAVGMATNIPTHNLGEVIDACLAYIENPELTDEEILQLVPGPDFPTGGIILGRKGSREAVTTGRGSVVMRAKTEFEQIGNRRAIIVTEMPYQVNKAQVLEKIGELVREKKIEGIAEMRDESDKSGVRVVIEVKKDAMEEVILNQLFNYTQLQTSFGVNMLALDRGRPKLLNIREVIAAFCKFREEVVTRRTRYLLNKARDRAHILIGLSIAVANIDEVIKVIRGAADPQTAKEELLARAWPAADIQPLIDLVADRNNEIIDGKCYFTEEQAKAILEMRLSRLTGLERDKIHDELAQLAQEIKGYLEILASREKLFEIIRKELVDIKEEFATPRKTEFEESEFERDIEDLIPREDMVVTVTVGGYIKRVPLSTYRAQKRGGKGRSGLAMHDEDATIKVFVTNTHTPMLFFSTNGKVYRTKVYKLPLGTPQSKGRALVNIFPLEKDETINVVLPLPTDESEQEKLNIMFATRSGNARRNSIDDFSYVPSNGKIAIKLDEGDSLVSARICAEDQHILMSARSGKSIRFPVDSVRQFKSRTSTGVRGMKLAEGDSITSMTVLNGTEQDVETRDIYLKIPATIRAQLSALVEEAKEESLTDEERNAVQADIEKVMAAIDSELPREVLLEWAEHEQFVLAVTENGYGKRTSAYEYRITNRGGSGVVNIITSERNGKVVSSYCVEENHEIMLITTSGKLIRCAVKDIRIAGRNTQGVTIFRLDKGEKVISVALVEESNRREELEDEPIEGEASAEASTTDTSNESPNTSEEAPSENGDE